MNIGKRIENIENAVKTKAKYKIYDNLGNVVLGLPLGAKVKPCDILVVPIVERDGIQVSRLPEKFYRAKEVIKVISEIVKP